MKFKKVLSSELVPQWQDRYVNFYFLKECIYHHAQANAGVEGEEEGEEGASKSAVELQAMDYSRNRRPSIYEKKIPIRIFETFEVELSKEASKVDHFYKSRQDKFSERLRELNSEIEVMKSGVNATPSAINALRKAYHDNVMNWKLLKKFQETNKYGFLKLIKRHDTELGVGQFDYLLETCLQPFAFWDSKFVEDTIAETKKVYTQYFAASDERLAKSELRRADSKRRSINLFFVALFTGAISVLFFLSLYSWVRYYPSDPPQFSSVGWFVYRILLLPIGLGALFSLSAYLWEKHHINYVFIFKFNPLHYRSPLMYLKYSLCMLTLWLLSFYFHLDAIISDVKVFHGLLHPLLFVSVLVTGFFLPLPILGHNTRFYLIKEVSRVLRAGLPGRINVSFADFIMAIKLIALSEFLFDFQIMFCMFGLRSDELCEDKAYALPFLSALPHWCRMFQCVRRWRQTGQAYPHLASGIRPATTLISLTLSVLASNYPEHIWIRYLWLGLNAVFSVIRWYLDVLIDWSFIKFGFHFKLREQRLYKPTWLYYFVMVDNLFLRYVWLVVYFMRTAGLDLSHPILLLFLSSFELVWGFQFVFFRMENEHFNCKDRYDIIHDVPLPFSKKYDALARKNALKNANRDKRKIHASFVGWINSAWDKLPWTNSHHKLHQSIQQAIEEVEREHKKPQSSASISNFSNFHFENLCDSRRHVTSLANSPAVSPSVSFGNLSQLAAQKRAVSVVLGPAQRLPATPSSTPVHSPITSPGHSPHHSPHPSPPPSPRGSPHASPSTSPAPHHLARRSLRLSSDAHHSYVPLSEPLSKLKEEDKEKEKERELEKERHREMEKERHREMEKERHKESEKEKERVRERGLEEIRNLSSPMLADYSPDINTASPEVECNFILQ